MKTGAISRKHPATKIDESLSVSDMSSVLGSVSFSDEIEEPMPSKRGLSAAPTPHKRTLAPFQLSVTNSMDLNGTSMDSDVEIDFSEEDTPPNSSRQV